MRIGIDARLWNETGVGRYIRNLVMQLQEIDQKNEYVLFVKSLGDVAVSPPRWKIVATDIRWHTIEEQVKFPKILEKENLDLVHFPYFSIPIFYNRPYVITIHDLIINHYPTGKASTLPFPLYQLKRFGYQYVLNHAASKAKKIITVSEATKLEIVDHLNVSKEKIVVTYEGVDERVKGDKTFPFPLHPFPYLLYVGNAYPHKNLERLVEAFQLIYQEYPYVKLVLVGKENYFYDRLKESVREMGLEKVVVFVGGVSDEELILLYKNAKALVLPSLMEGFGLPGLEAMQQECLVLASDIPVFREIYHDAAIYFNPLAVNAIHVTIREVLENKKDFRKIIEKGSKRVDAFSWKKMTEETLKIYENSLGIRSD